MTNKETKRNKENTKSNKQMLNEFFEYLSLTKEEIKDIFKNNTTRELADNVIKILDEVNSMTTLEKETLLNMTEEEILNEEVA